MFSSQKPYGGNSNNYQNNDIYGNTSHYSSANSNQQNDSFWGNRGSNRLNNPSEPTLSAAIANDSLYGYNSLNNNKLAESSRASGRYFDCNHF